MAVGRRNAFGVGTLTTSLATLVTAGAAPSDGSAKASGVFTLANNGSATTASAKKGPSGGTKNFIPTTFPLPANDNYVHNATIDLMGTQIIEGVAAAGTQVDWIFDGVEASDS